MKLLLEPNLLSYSDEAYEADLKLLPSQRYEAAMRYRFLQDRKRSVRAYMLLWQGLRDEYGLDSAPVFSFGEHGKPYLASEPGIHFSLSHTGNAVLCALDSRPVGADIEMIRKSDFSHLLSVFSDPEQALILRSDRPEQCFMRLWTRKESYLKLTGQGLVGTKALKDVPTDDTGTVSFETTVREDAGFLYSVCRQITSM